MKKRLLLFSSVVFLILGFLFFAPAKTHAFSFGDIVDGVKNFFAAKPPKELTIDSKIELAPEGDMNNDKQIDSGDFVTFTYTITNPTNNSYHLVTVKTNIKRDDLNLIRNIQGTVNLDYMHNNTITLPYVYIEPHQVRTISFEARINFNKDTDKLLSTEPEIVDDKDSSLFKAAKEEVTSKKMKIEKYDQLTNK